MKSDDYKVGITIIGCCSMNKYAYQILLLELGAAGVNDWSDSSYTVMSIVLFDASRLVLQLNTRG